MNKKEKLFDKYKDAQIWIDKTSIELDCIGDPNKRVVFKGYRIDHKVIIKVKHKYHAIIAYDNYTKNKDKSFDNYKDANKWILKWTKKIDGDIIKLKIPKINIKKISGHEKSRVDDSGIKVTGEVYLAYIHYDNYESSLTKIFKVRIDAKEWIKQQINIIDDITELKTTSYETFQYRDQQKRSENFIKKQKNLYKSFEEIMKKHADGFKWRDYEESETKKSNTTKTTTKKEVTDELTTKTKKEKISQTNSFGRDF